jgi:hypothetical protein
MNTGQAETSVTLYEAMTSMRTLEHPLMGHLDWSGMTTTCDWSGTIQLPAFIECYEKWKSDATEFFRDRRSDAHRRGEFGFSVLAGSPRVGFGPGKDVDEYLQPSAAQCAAYSMLTQHSDRLAESLKAELALYVRECGLDFYLLESHEFEFLLRPENILGTLELQGLTITYHTRDNLALVGMVFHSEIWEGEHGVGAMVLGDQVIHLGVAEEAWPDSMMGDP